jgi:hypothetical protein
MNIIAPVRLVLGIPAVTKSRIGFLVALVAVISIVGKEAIAHFELLNRNEAVICIALGLVGSLSWITGRLSQGARAQPGTAQSQEGSEDQMTAEHPLAFFTSAKYWGMILVLSAAILSVVAATRRAPVMTVRARVQPTVFVTITNVVTVTNEAPKASFNVVAHEAPKATFPPMELQGIVLNGTKSSAVINGRVLCIGEGLSNVVLVAVDAEHATVELQGQTKTLALRR